VVGNSRSWEDGTPSRLSVTRAIGLEVSNSCDCGLGIDDIDQFFLKCTLYDKLHQVLKQDVMNVWEACESRGSLNLSVQLLLFPFTTNQLVMWNAMIYCQQLSTRTLLITLSVIDNYEVIFSVQSSHSIITYRLW